MKSRHFLSQSSSLNATRLEHTTTTQGHFKDQCRVQTISDVCQFTMRVFYEYSILSFYVYTRYRQLQLTADSRQSELQKEISVKQFELERLQMILDETANNLNQAKLEAEKYQSKSEV